MNLSACPKCGFLLTAPGPDCPRCGVIFARIRWQQDAPPLSAPGAEADTEPGTTLRELLLPPASAAMSPGWWGRAAVFAVLLFWSGPLILGGVTGDAAGGSFLHLVNLPFHEAGHLLFRPFGQLTASLGGTLGQMLVPLVCLAALLFKTRDPLGASVCLWWFGENFLDIAPYIADARAGELPLLGGNFGNSSPYGFHDWEYILGETGLLRHDLALARTAHAVGGAVMCLALAWATLLLWRQLQQSRAKATFRGRN